MEDKSDSTKNGTSEHLEILETTGGKKIWTQIWKTSDYNSETQAYLLFIPGIGDHFTRYTPLFQHLAKSGIQVYSFDHRGFGHSKGDTPFSTTWESMMDDTTFVHSKIPSNDKPIYILGSDTGALLGLSFVLKYSPETHRADGLVLCSPMLKAKVVKYSLRRSSLKLRGLVTPESTTTWITPKLMSRDASVV